MHVSINELLHFDATGILYVKFNYFRIKLYLCENNTQWQLQLFMNVSFRMNTFECDTSIHDICINNFCCTLPFQRNFYAHVKFWHILYANIYKSVNDKIGHQQNQKSYC